MRNEDTLGASGVEVQVHIEKRLTICEGCLISGHRACKLLTDAGTDVIG